MNSVVVGRIVVLIIVIGLAVGAYNMWSGHSIGLPTIPGVGGSSDVTVLTSATKADWLNDEIAAFNSQNQGKYHVSMLPLAESRDAMHDILNGKTKPTIWSPSSPVWITRLGEVWSQQHPGQTLVDPNSYQSYRMLLKSPLVVITTKDKAAFFRQVFSGPTPWSTIKDLSLGRRRAPWGDFKFAHADPLDASSGMLTMSLILTEYATQHNQLGDMSGCAATAGFRDFLVAMDKKFVYDPSAVGSTALEKAYETDPTSRDFITAYESKAFDAVANNPNLEVVYPQPTAVADQAGAVLTADWVSPQQKDAAQAFLDYLASSTSLGNAVQKYHFRPEQASGDVSLASQISSDKENGFQQTYNAIESPPYDALNEAANQWRIYVAHQTAQ